MSTRPMTDGRRARGTKTAERILAACRALMLDRTFQPTVLAVANAANVSIRSVFQHFGTIEDLRLEAITDDAVRDEIVAGTVGPDLAPLLGQQVRICIIHVAVFGRPHGSLLQGYVPTEAAA